MKKKFSGTQGIVIKDVSLFVGTDMGIPQENLPMFYFCKAVPEIHPAGADRFYFRTGQGNAALIGVVDEIIPFLQEALYEKRKNGTADSS